MELTQRVELELKAGRELTEPLVVCHLEAEHAIASDEPHRHREHRSIVCLQGSELQTTVPRETVDNFAKEVRMLWRGSHRRALGSLPA